MTGFKMDIFDVVDVAGVKDEMVVGFSIDKTVSDALNPYVQATETQCILTKQVAEKEKAAPSPAWSGYTVSDALNPYVQAT